jgi:hypothetical protein
MEMTIEENGKRKHVVPSPLTGIGDRGMTMILLISRARKKTKVAEYKSAVLAVNRYRVF